MISQTVFSYLYILIALGIIIPLVIWTIWILVKKEKITTVLAGALTFFIAAVVFESIPKALLLQIPSPVSQFIMGHAWAYCIVGALIAGVFEETGRFILFKYILKNRTKKPTAISAGLGHGLFEMMFLFVIQGVQYLMYAFMINAGTFNAVIAEAAAASPETAEQLSALPGQLAAVSVSMIPISLTERAGAVLFHVGASILVFYAVRTSGKKWAYPLAILLHTLLDIIAAMAQIGVITNVYVIEGSLLICGIAMFVGTYIFAYRKMPCEKEETAE